jgi:hypothetical protein
MGKTIFGLKVINADKSEITLAQAIKRSFAYFICVMLGSVLFTLSFFRKDQKSLADLLSASAVTIEEHEEVLADDKVGTEFQLTLLHTIENTEEDPEYFEQNKSA